jgi:hypothetical protein
MQKPQIVKHSTYIIKDENGNVINRIIANENFVSKNFEYYEFESSVIDNTQELIQWRNSELVRTDELVNLVDYPYIEEMKEYRQRLRDWPDSEDFPETFPDFDAIVEEFKQSANRNI